MVRTQIYLTDEQHGALQRAADEQGISMTELVRRMIERQVLGRAGSAEYRKDAVMSFIGLGDSGRDDVSERHDEALDESFRGAPVR